MATSPDYAGVESGIKQGYDAQRQKAAQQEAGNLQSQRDALARRQAQLGGGPGGAFIKAEQMAGDESAQRGQQANASIDSAQAQELRNVKMTQLGQQFTTSERQGSEAHADTAQAKTFAHEDTSQQTGIAAAEKQQATQINANSSLQDRQLAAQAIMQQKGIEATSDLSAKQIAAQEIMQKTGLDAQAAMQAVGITAQKDMQETAQKFQGDQAKLDRDVKVDEFLQTIGLSKEEFAHQVGVDQFNEDMANKMFEKKDMLESAFGSLGGNKISQSGKGAGGKLSDWWKDFTSSN